MSQERQLIVRALDELSCAVEDLARQLHHTEGYLVSNLRTYNSPSDYLLSNRLASARSIIHSLNQLSATNKDNVHLLTNDEEKKKRTPTIEPIRPQDIVLGTQIPDIFIMRSD